MAEHADVLGAQVAQCAELFVFEDYEVARLLVVALGAFLAFLALGALGALGALWAFCAWSMYAFCSVAFVLLARGFVPLRR